MYIDQSCFVLFLFVCLWSELKRMHLMGTDCFSFLFICLLFAFLRAGLNKIVFRIQNNYTS